MNIQVETGSNRDGKHCQPCSISIVKLVYFHQLSQSLSIVSPRNPPSLLEVNSQKMAINYRPESSGCVCIPA
jgi:hypothetical protein